MKKELEQEIRKRAPNFLDGLNFISCDDGWALLLQKAVELIEYHIDNQVPAELKSQIKAVQIKEKFGSLRLYVSNSTPFIDGVINLAESISDSTCESCGNLGSRRSLNYIQTLCEPCYQVKLGSKK